MTDKGYDLYVDGSPGPKKGPGWAGWGMALMAGDAPLYEACGVAADRLTTNAIELEAMIQGLAYLLRQNWQTVTQVWTDSQYAASCVAALPKLGASRFQSDGGFGPPVKNAERLRLLYDLMYNLELAGRVIVRHTKGHAGTAGNERADKLSKLAAYGGEVWTSTYS